MSLRVNFPEKGYLARKLKTGAWYFTMNVANYNSIKKLVFLTSKPNLTKHISGTLKSLPMLANMKPVAKIIKIPKFTSFRNKLKCPRHDFPVYSYKRSSLLGKLVNYGYKKFYNIGPWTELSACGLT